jgi:hypothetical protein
MVAGAADWQACPELARDPEKWEPVFGKDHAQSKDLERDDDSKKNHPALTPTGMGMMTLPLHAKF